MVFTREQLEQELSQRVQALYSGQLGHQPDETICQFFNEKLTILLENAITQPEQLLVKSGNRELAQKVRRSLEAILKPRLQAVIEEMTQSTICDFLTSAQMDTGRISIIAVLREPPHCSPSSLKQERSHVDENSIG